MSLTEAGEGTIAAWGHFRHGADIGVRGEGDSVAGAFEQAAIALTAVIVDPTRVAARRAIEIRCQAPDLEVLLVDWLNALVYEMATRRMLFKRFEIDLQGTELRARAWGEPIDPLRHRPVVEVKGATYTELAVKTLPGGAWLAQCVIDV